MTPARKRFAVASGLPPSAEDISGVTAPGRQDVRDVGLRTEAQGGRTAFTWRLTAEQGLALDEDDTPA